MLSFVFIVCYLLYFRNLGYKGKNLFTTRVRHWTKIFYLTSTLRPSDVLMPEVNDVCLHPLRLYIHGMTLSLWTARSHVTPCCCSPWADAVRTVPAPELNQMRILSDKVKKRHVTPMRIYNFIVCNQMQP